MGPEVRSPFPSSTAQQRLASATGPSSAQDAVAGQLESQHFFRTGDTIRDADGHAGLVLDGWALHASVLWDDGRRQEIEQFDPRVTVVTRAAAR
jgi:hypothetical protein